MFFGCYFMNFFDIFVRLGVNMLLFWRGRKENGKERRYNIVVFNE